MRLHPRRGYADSSFKRRGWGATSTKLFDESDSYKAPSSFLQISPFVSRASVPTSASMASDNGLYDVPLLNRGARLFLGTQKAAQDRSLLRRCGISRIVCVGTPAFHQQPGAGGDEGGVDTTVNTDESGSRGEGKVVGFLYLEIPILDLPSENLLAHLDRSASFIAQGVSLGDNVLVNCVYAQSRSASIVAGYLMKQESLSLTQAIGRIKEAQPTVHVNPGFEAQLELYWDLGCSLPGSRRRTAEGKVPEVSVQTDTDPKLWAAPTYRWFTFACRLKTNGGNTRRGRGNGGNGDTACGLQPEGIRLPTGGDDDRGGGQTGKIEGPTTTMLYRCKTCRAPLFRDSNVLDHSHSIILAASDSIYASFSRHGDGSSWLKARDAAAAAAKTPTSTTELVAGSKHRQPDLRSRANVVGRGDSMSSNTLGVASSVGRGRCSSIFTEPLDWVGIRESGERRAKVTCPGRKGTAACGSKLGAWSLEGANCSCGRMVKPAIQFTLSRVECVKRN